MCSALRGRSSLNARAEELRGDLAGSPEPDDNLLFRFFTDRSFTEHLVDWERHARLALRQFRAVAARNRLDPGLPALIRGLTDASPPFALWWGGSDIAGRDDGYKRFNHPVHGALDFHYVVLRSSAGTGIEVVTFMPLLEGPRIESRGMV